MLLYLVDKGSVLATAQTNFKSIVDANKFYIFRHHTFILNLHKFKINISSDDIGLPYTN